MRRRPETERRKLPRQARSRATTDIILEAAARALTREGYERTTTNRIAELAGVSVGSLYQYFPSKAALIAALIERHCEAMQEEVRGALARLGNAPLEQLVREMVEALLRAHALAPHLHRVLMEEMPSLGRLRKIDALDAEFHRIVEQQLVARSREVRPTNVALSAFIIVTAVESLTHAAVVHHPERLKDPELVDEITAMVVRYLEKR